MMLASSRRSLGPGVLAALLSIGPASALAQEVGVKVGVNSASLTAEEDEDPPISRRVGPIGGVWVRIAQSPRLSFQVEGLFSEKGAKVEAPPEFGESFALRLRYFEIPLLARGDFGASGSAARGFVVGGAAPAFKLSAHSTAVIGGDEETREVGEAVYGADLGLVGGVGVTFGRALIEARYTHGLRHTNTDDNGDEDRVKNRVFSVMFGFRVR